MRLPGSTVEPFSVEDGGLRAVVRRNLEGGAGLVLIAFAAMLAAALATWSIEDPSFNHATDGPIRNVMGYGGAVISDLAMQILGLAAIAIPVPVAFWGARLLFRRHRRFARRHLWAWIGGTLLAAGGLAMIIPSAGWPLPTGFGGLVGDVLMLVPLSLFQAPAFGGFAKLVGMIYAIAAALLLAYAMGIDPRRPMTFRWRRAAPADVPSADDFYDDDEETDDGKGSAILGALTHGVLVARANLRRLTGLRPAAVGGLRLPDMSIGKLREAVFDRQPVEEEEPGSRIEPQFGGAAPIPEAPVGNSDEPYDAEDHTPTPPQPRKRVQSPAPKPKPGKRLAKEAQPSFLNADSFELPPLHLLSEPPRVNRRSAVSADALEQNARILEGVLEDFGVRGEIFNVRPGPVVTLYELEPAPGIKSSRVIGLADDIARSMSAISARVAVIPGKNAIGIELPNQRRETVFLRELLAAEDFEKSKAKLAVCLGKTIGGEPVIADLARMPHLLVAGTTGSGKSVSVNTMVLSLIYRLSPDQCKLIMIDPKMLELSVYDGIPHLLTPVVTDPKKAVVALKWTVREMEDRYKKMSKLGVRNIDGFNARVQQALKKGEVLTRTVQTGFDRDTGEAIYEQEELELQPLPFIVVLVDEMADLMMVAGKDIEGAIQRLAQMARAAGIHLIMATQRPSVDVITGTIKANFPTRVSFQVTSKIDSRTILGEQGAEQLLGQGDMLYMAGGGRIQRVHGPFVADDEVENIVAYLKTQGVPQYLDTITEDDETTEGGYDLDGGGGGESNDLYDKAVAIVLHDRKASTSYIQRRLSIGYNRAATLIERMEQEGVIGAANHAGKREILVGGDEPEGF